MLDLKTLSTTEACNKAFELEIVHPISKRGLDQFISIVGKDSVQFKTALAEQQDAAMRKAEAAKRKGRNASLPTFAESQASGVELLAACILGFRNVVFNGGPLEYSRANVIKLLTELDFVREQVDSAVVDLENFMKA